MILTYEKPFFICKATFAERKAPQKAGFRFDKESGRFFTGELRVASRLREHADVRARKLLNRALITVKPWTGRIPHPEGLKPEKYQVEAARFALSRNRSYLWADPGLGKTIMAALIMNAHPAHLIFYVCPPSLCLNVADELERWTSRKIYTGVPSAFGELTPAVWIIPDTQLSNEFNHDFFLLALKDMRRYKLSTMLFVDEAHRYKNDDSGRALFLFNAYAARIRQQVWLSGTAMPNRPLELYPVLSHCAPETINFMDKTQFGLHYCGGRWNGHGYDFKGATNMKQLAKKVIGTFMYRLKKDVLKLPPIRHEVVVIGETMSPALIALDRALLKEFSPEDLMGHLAPNEHVSTYRKELGKLKAKAVLPFLKHLAEDTDEFIIISTVHKDAIAILKAGLAKYRPAVIDGSVPTSRRVAIAQAWQADLTSRFFLLNNIAGGLGFNLTKASRVVQVEFSWTDSENQQVHDRAHRFGQKGSVLNQYIVYKNSLDRKIIETAMRKKSLVDSM